MSNLDDLSQAERSYLDSRGTQTEALVAENPDLKSASPDIGEVERPTTEGPSQFESRETPQVEEGGEPFQGSHPKRVGYQKYREAQDRIAALEAEARARAENEAVLNERLKLIGEAIQADEQAVIDDDPPPDPTQDAYAHMEWQNRQREKDRQEFQQFQQNQAQQAEQARVVQVYREDAARFSLQQPAFMPAHNYLLAHRDRELSVFHPQLTPQQRYQVLVEEEYNLARESLAAGQSPSARIFEVARLRGFDNWYAAQQGNGASPAAYAPETNGAVPTYTPPAQPSSAVQQVQNIARNQNAARSLSQAGGGVAVSQFSARDLAEMSNEQFAEVFSRLQGSGNKARLRELMGS